MMSQSVNGTKTAAADAAVANVITVLLRRRVLARHQAAAILSRAERLELGVDRAAVSPRALFELTDRHGISAYDAAYLELAARRGLPLATRDANLARAARAAGSPSVDPLTLPLATYVEDFHHQVSAPCRAHRSAG